MTVTMIQAFQEALKRHQVCLHPTDSLPGLAFDPTADPALDNLAVIKAHRQSKGFVGLISEQGAAAKFWEPLPAGWDQALTRLWPGPLSVVWRASSAVPPALQAADGTACLRVPLLPDHGLWLAEVLAGLPWPLPSTSCNLSGQAPYGDWQKAQEFLEGFGPIGYAPAGQMPYEVVAPRASTVIKILGAGEFQMLREGAVSVAAIQAILTAVTSEP